MNKLSGIIVCISLLLIIASMGFVLAENYSTDNNKSRDESGNTTSCILEGGKGRIFNNESCCDGLTSIGNSQYAQGHCIAVTDGSFKCTRCGNGICGLGENECNCPKDCENVTLTPITPSCSNIGTKREGWHDSNGLIKYATCKGCIAECKYTGKRSEGWYSSCDKTIIKYDQCSNSTTPEPVCQDLYWFDNEHRECGYKQFCGMYMYYGLQTFKTKDECNNALNSNVTCESYKCDDGTMAECNLLETGECICSTCPSIIIKPSCGNGICESGEGEMCACPAIEILCREGKECKAPPCTCKVQCPVDCSNLEPIYPNLNEKFKFSVYQLAKIMQNDEPLMKIQFKDLIAYKCDEMPVSKDLGDVITTKIKAATGNVVSLEEESPSSGEGRGQVQGSQGPTEVVSNIIRCNGSGPKALLDIEFDYDGNQSKHNIINLDLNEKKQINGFTISFLGYDYASRTGTFLVEKGIFTCPLNCKCSPDGQTISCHTQECVPGTILCPDGTCKKKCDVIDEECKYGCTFEGKCFPISIRNNGMYCGTDLAMSTQKGENDACQNNFECKTNVCVDDKCISSGLIQKMVSWFKIMFGSK